MDCPRKNHADRIHEALGLDPAIQREAAATVHVAENRTYMDTLRRLLLVLREHGVTRVTVSFEGHGDHSSIEGIHYKSPNAFNAEYHYLAGDGLHFKTLRERYRVTTSGGGCRAGDG